MIRRLKFQVKEAANVEKYMLSSYILIFMRTELHIKLINGITDQNRTEKNNHQIVRVVLSRDKSEGTSNIVASAFCQKTNRRHFENN